MVQFLSGAGIRESDFAARLGDFVSLFFFINVIGSLVPCEQ